MEIEETGERGCGVCEYSIYPAGAALAGLGWRSVRRYAIIAL